MSVANDAGAARDRRLAEILASIEAVDPAMVEQGLQCKAAAEEMGLRLGLGEILVDRGWLTDADFLKARQIGAKERMFFVDRSSMRDLAIQPAEDEEMGRLAMAYYLVDAGGLARAGEVQRNAAGLGLRVALGKVFADLDILDCEVSEGLLKSIRLRTGTLGDEAPPFDEDDLAFGAAGAVHGMITRQQYERALKLKTRLRKAGIEKNIGEIFYEQSILEIEAMDDIATAAERSLQPPRPIALYLIRLTDVDNAHLLGDIQRNRLAGPQAIGTAMNVQGRLEKLGIERTLARVLIDLGEIDPDTLDASIGRRPLVRATG